MFKVKVYVTTKANVLDPQGTAVQQALHTMGYGDVEEVRIGKYLELTLDTEDRAQAEADVEKMCKQLLANPVVEDYRYELED
ncbi:phosphoribosylformylglycinamidine synthase subunit PurS [Paenibacillus apiarius]|uniref:phosphoribosylformylglycinamidine synthase subunit PurS n=1 Tax=Paenibacillus apiarius TaxID=46240 RepID=UPI00197FF019|nr:phosphoribosylformylglycinamidine synthase subunit PurS [Paenibacillus apiarius]MBN3525030.1 phosphoribosylformylglycinamidine synthase subunit PurS [Paenibacillus apiarius]